jgi:hypothetical protein
MVLSFVSDYCVAQISSVTEMQHGIMSMNLGSRLSLSHFDCVILSNFIKHGFFSFVKSRELITSTSKG